MASTSSSDRGSQPAAPFPELKTTAPNKDAERRRIPRVKMAGCFTATFEPTKETSGGLAVIELKDGSPKGIGAFSPIAVQPGTRVNLFQSGSRIPIHKGTVVRCEEETTEVDGTPLPRSRHLLGILFNNRD
ncbi:MAG: hypothetical protein H6815_06345 [Phycisphaeraceae bacterium]|nr:hypothetical protein [Phycisphaeraceae bacterium]